MKITRYKISKETGISETNLLNIYKGKNKPSVDFIEKILNIYKVLNPTWLLTGEGPMLRSEITDQEPQKKNDIPPVTNSPPACPLCYEKERIIKEKERIIAAHEETITLLKEQLQEYRSRAKEGDTVFIAAKTPTQEPEPAKLK